MRLLCFAYWCYFTFVILGAAFPALSGQRNRLPLPCDNRQQKGIRTALLSNSRQHGGFGRSTKVQFGYPSPAFLNPTQLFLNRQQNDEQRLPLFKENARQLFHSQALVHRVCIQLCVESFVSVIIVTDATWYICRYSRGIGKQILLVSLFIKYLYSEIKSTDGELFDTATLLLCFIAVSHCVGVYRVVLCFLFRYVLYLVMF